MDNKNLSVIGRRELVDFPKLALKNIEAKVDTGAYTSSIHCSSITIDGEQVTCIFLDPSHALYTGELMTFKIRKKVMVRSSNGTEEKRVVIKTKIHLMGETFRIRLTLTDRSNMNYPILIGRRFLRKKFLVDVNRKHQSAAL